MIVEMEVVGKEVVGEFVVGDDKGNDAEDEIERDVVCLSW